MLQYVAQHAQLPRLVGRCDSGSSGCSRGSSGTSVTLNVLDTLPVVVNQAPILSNINLLAADDTGTLGDNITTLGAPRFTGTGAQASATIKLWEGSTHSVTSTRHSCADDTLKAPALLAWRLKYADSAADTEYATADSDLSYEYVSVEPASIIV